MKFFDNIIGVHPEEETRKLGAVSKSKKNGDTAGIAAPLPSENNRDQIQGKSKIDGFAAGAIVIEGDVDDLDALADIENAAIIDDLHDRTSGQEDDKTTISAEAPLEVSNPQDGDEIVAEKMPVVEVAAESQDNLELEKDEKEKAPIVDLEKMKEESIRTRKIHESASTFLLAGRDKIKVDHPAAAQRAGALAVASKFASVDVLSQPSDNRVEGGDQLHA